MFLWALIPTSVKWIGLSVLIGLVGLGAWKWEHAGKLKAQAAKATAEQGLQIGYEGDVKLCQEREAIKARADQQRRKLNELLQKKIWMVLLIPSITLAGCAAPCSQIPREALKPLPVTKLPTEPRLNTRKLLDAQGKPAGLLFPTEDAFAEADYKVELKEAAELGIVNTVAANKIFEILAAPQKKWWQFWR